MRTIGTRKVDVGGKPHHLCGFHLSGACRSHEREEKGNLLFRGK